MTVSKSGSALKPPSTRVEPPAGSPTPAGDRPQVSRPMTGDAEWNQRAVANQKRMATDEAFREEVEKLLF